ncbi:MAG: hypothetical protein AAGB25_00880 [Pseudomonadota bacterium]
MAGKRKPQTLADKRNAAADAALTLAAETPWGAIAPQSIAAAADLDISDLYDIGGKSALLKEIDKRFDRAMGAGFAPLGPDATGPERRERLLDVMMQRFDLLEASRAGVMSIREHVMQLPAERLRAARRRYLTAEWALEAAEVPGPGLAAKAAALAASFLKAERIWEADEAPLDRTMAALDRDLRRYSDWMRDMSQMADWARGDRRRSETPEEASVKPEDDSNMDDPPDPNAPPPPLDL